MPDSFSDKNDGDHHKNKNNEKGKIRQEGRIGIELFVQIRDTIARTLKPDQHTHYQRHEKNSSARNPRL